MLFCKNLFKKNIFRICPNASTSITENFHRELLSRARIKMLNNLDMAFASCIFLRSLLNRAIPFGIGCTGRT